MKCRPTSETIIWDMFRKWISSHRDLPMKINQYIPKTHTPETRILGTKIRTQITQQSR
jgi:prolyl-tRNA synthetase